MKATKVTLKQLKQMDKFEGVNRKGVKAIFTVSGDVAVAKFEDGSEKEMKLDSVRRSWLVVNEIKEGDDERMKIFIPGVKVKDSVTGKEGTITEVIGKLATVENDIEDFAANTDNLTVIEDAPKRDNVVKFEKPEDKKEEPAKKEEPKKVKQEEEFKSPAVVAEQIELEEQGIRLLNYETAMARKHMKSITDIALNDRVMRIRQNGEYIMSVRIYDVNGDLVYDSKTQSVKDALEHMGYEGDLLKEARKQITQLRKQARQGAEVQKPE